MNIADTKRELYFEGLKDNTLYIEIDNIRSGLRKPDYDYFNISKLGFDDFLFVNFIDVMDEFFSKNKNKAIKACVEKSKSTGILFITVRGYAEIFGYSKHSIERLRPELKKKRIFPDYAFIENREHIFKFNDLENFFQFNKLLSGFYYSVVSFCEHSNVNFHAAKTVMGKIDVEPVQYFHKTAYYNLEDLANAFAKYGKDKTDQIGERIQSKYGKVKVFKKTLAKLKEEYPDMDEDVLTINRFCEIYSQEKHRYSAISTYVSKLKSGLKEKNIRPDYYTTDEKPLYLREVLSSVMAEIKDKENEEKLKNIDKYVKTI